jgi:uncharacterized membrane protein
MQSRNLQYLPAVDHLRALAALLLILYHGQQLITADASVRRGLPRPDWLFTANPLSALIIEGHTAVGLFMVLSGFIFTYGARGRDIAYWPFLKNRLLRIYPLYLFLIVVEIYALPRTFTLTGLHSSLLCLSNLPGHRFPCVARRALILEPGNTVRLGNSNERTAAAHLECGDSSPLLFLCFCVFLRGPAREQRR